MRLMCVAFFENPGEAIVTVKVGNESIEKRVSVIEIPIKVELPHYVLRNDKMVQEGWVGGNSIQEVIQTLGFPTRKESFTVKWPKKDLIDNISYEPEVSECNLSIQHFYYDKYPELAIAIVGNKARRVSLKFLQYNLHGIGIPAIMNFLPHDKRSWLAGAGQGCAGLILAGIVGLLGSGILVGSLLVSLLF